MSSRRNEWRRVCIVLLVGLYPLSYGKYRFRAQRLPEKEEIFHYRLTPRKNPLYKSILDANQIFGGVDLAGTPAIFRTHTDRTGEFPELVFDTTLDLAHGRSQEVTRYLVRDGRLVLDRLERQVHSSNGEVVREEKVLFHDGPYQFPNDLYPEVYAPFLMRSDPSIKGRRSFHAWISDRFVARIYFELQKSRVKTRVPAGNFLCSQFLMYPDLNDWVPLGNVVMALAKPILPRYHIWLGLDPPYPVVRFEGAYGPPGAPEVVVELLKQEL